MGSYLSSCHISRVWALFVNSDFVLSQAQCEQYSHFSSFWWALYSLFVVVFLSHYFLTVKWILLAICTVMQCHLNSITCTKLICLCCNFKDVQNYANCKESTAVFTFANANWFSNDVASWSMMSLVLVIGKLNSKNFHLQVFGSTVLKNTLYEVVMHKWNII